MINDTLKQIEEDFDKRASFNGFDGEQTVKYLIKNKERWIGVMPEVEGYALRDIADDHFHIDTLLIKCETAEIAKEFLPLLKKNLNPDEASCELDSQQYQGATERIIRLWWD